MMTVSAPASAADLFAPHTGHRLSIVVQGAVVAGNIVQTANHCRHWRDLFPNAEIILAISSPDIIEGIHPDGDPTGLVLHVPKGDAGLAYAALDVIKSVCDQVVQAHGALPLPPIKTDSPGTNNINLQIAAAQAGLVRATGTHILRLRNDLIFADDNFVKQWLEGNRLPRGACAALQERVLISYLYTLNPYTYERMPFHYSDWFHFGLAQDVKALWDVPFMTMAQAIHYKHHPCAEHSNYQERRMLTRLAVEQHVAYSSLKRHFHDLKLEHHNDLADVRRSVDILCDNFIVCDPIAAKIVFEKYVRDFANPLKKLHCIPPEDWALLVSLLPAQREPVLLERARIANNPALAPFPRYYPASTLSTQTGEHAHGAIMAMSRAGLLIHGPYDTLPRGAFTALIDVRRFDGKGMLEIRFTLEGGAEELARHRVALCDVRDETIALHFDIDRDEGKLFEIVVEAPGIPLIVIGSVTIQHRETGAASAFSMQLSAVNSPFKSHAGIKKQGMLHTSGKAGRLLFGPYLTLPRGQYNLHIAVPEGQSPGHSHIEIWGGGKQIAYRRIRQNDLAAGRIELLFFLSHNATDIEFRIDTNRYADFALAQVDLICRSACVTLMNVTKQAVMSTINIIVHALRGLVEVK